MSSSLPGLMLPTVKSMTGSTPADSARISMINKAQSQTNANKLMAGGKIKRKRARYGGSASRFVIPQYQVLYEPQGGTGTNPNDQIQVNSQTSTQMAANSVYDNNATKMGGSKRRRGGNPDWIWGCMSGGKKKSKKCRSIRQRNKHKKTRKNRKH